MRMRSGVKLLLSLMATCATFVMLAVPGVHLDAYAAPVLTNVNPQTVYPGGALTVTGQGLGNMAAWTAVVELKNGEKFEQPVQAVNATQFKIKAPFIYGGYNVTAKNALHRARLMQIKQLYVKQGSIMSNKLPFNIVSPYPILDSPDNSTQTAGSGMVVAGGNWDRTSIYLPGMYYWAIFEYLPGKVVKTPILPPAPQVPPIPIPLQPNMTLVGNFLVHVPDVYAGKSEAEKQAISNYTGKLTIYGVMGQSFSSNALNIRIKPKQTQASNIPNPYNLTLSEYYAPSAPNRTMYYKGTSNIILPAPSTAKIKSVKNTSSYRIQLSYKDISGGNAVNGVWLNPNESTGAFNGKPARGSWEALGPESGSFSGQHHFIKIGISWQ